MKKYILTDADGVLLNWRSSFDQWMLDKGYIINRDETSYDISDLYDICPSEALSLIKAFNQSAAICTLEPFRDSKYWVNKIYENHGYRFKVLTSLSLCPYAHKARLLNLVTLFGEAIHSLICLDTCAPKDEALELYKDAILWIEDHPKNAEAGAKIGLKTLLMVHDHNEYHSSGENIIKINNWEDVYKLL